jgi:hypothetical protein
MGFNRVNPPKQVELPPEVANNPALRKAFDDSYYIMFQMWKRMGGGADWIDDNRTALYEFDDLTSFVEALSDNKPDIKLTTEDYTTIGDQTIICNAPLTVFLNKNPKDREQAKVIVVNGDVTIDGNGRSVNKMLQQFIVFKNLVTPATVDISYILETDEWFIV